MTVTETKYVCDICKAEVSESKDLLSVVLPYETYDDEHEDWKWWKGTIEDLLDQWTEEECPTTIEVSEDCIYTYCSRCGMRVVVDAPSVVPQVPSEDCISRVDLFEKMQSLCPETDKGCGDCHKVCDIDDCLDFVMNAPSVVPSRVEW